MRNSKFYLGILIFAFCILNFIGCATIGEFAKGIAGVSTKVLEDNRGSSIKKAFACDYNTCYKKTKKIVQRIGAYIYKEDKKKNLLAIYISETETTPVGLFFKEIDASNTQVEVSSASTFARELICGKVFSALEESLKPKEEKGEADAQETKEYK